jgi:hypothetical protein
VEIRGFALGTAVTDKFIPVPCRKDGYLSSPRREHYRDCATDYEAPSVQRNAPRWIKALTKFGFIAPASA